MSAPGPPLSIEELAQRREQTDAVSVLLQRRLEDHLSTLQLLLSPRWVLGRHTRAGARDDVPGADRHFGELKEIYGRHYGKPFLLPKELPEGPISIDGRLAVYPWEYTREVGEERRPIAMTSPVRWVVNYRSGYTLSQLRRALAARETLRRDDAREFVVNAIALRLVIEKMPGLVGLLSDLRYAVEFAPCDGLGELPLVSISAPLPSFRPDDELILSATRFSGVPAFIELIDVETLGALADPLRASIEQALAGGGQGG